MSLTPLVLSLTLACSTDTEQDASTVEDQPNVLVFTLDTLRADALGAYGNKTSPSPTLDALTQQGYRFTRAYTVTPLTIPAHSSLWTSLLPPRHGVQDNGDFFLDDGATTLAELLSADGYQTMASVGAEVTSHHWGFAQGFDAYYDDMGASRDTERNRWRVERPATDVVADALAWFDTEWDGKKPYFSWLHMFDIHHPYEPPEPHASAFPKRPYLGEIAWTDAVLGDLFRELEARGAMKNTWIFVLSDHGEGRGSHGEQLHGSLLYNSTTRIPLIVVPPTRDGGGARVDFPTSIVDIFPTTLGLAGLPVPDGLDGVSLVPWLSPTPAEPLKGRNVYLESLYAYRHYGWAPQKAWVTDERKLIDSTTPELYDAWDIQQRADLALTNADEVSKLTADLDAYTEGLVTEDAAAGRAELSEERLQQLAALGYITTTVNEDGPTDNLPDPVSRLHVLKEVERARALLQGGDLDAAQKQVDKVLSEEPTFVDMRALKIQLMMRRGELEKALKEAKELDSEHPSTNHKSLIAATQMRLGKTAAAAQTFKSIVDIDPYLKDSWSGLLTSLFLTGKVPNLDRAVNRAKQYHPNEAVVRTFEGIVLVMKGQPELAKPMLEQVLEISPSQPFANHSLGLIERAGGNADRAEQFLAEEIRLNPPAIPARRTMVEILAEQRRYAEQLDQLNAIRAIEPPNPLTLHSSAQALFNLQRFDEAEVLTNQCHELEESYAGCWMLAANILQKQGKEKQALEAYNRAVALSPGRTTPAGQ